MVCVEQSTYSVFILLLCFVVVVVVVVVVETLSSYVAQVGLKLVDWSSPPSVSPEWLEPQYVPATPSTLP